MLMAVIVNAAAKGGQVKPAVAIIATFVTTFVSGVIFMVIKMAMLGVVGELAAAMLPVVAMTAVFNAILVGALYLPSRRPLGSTNPLGFTSHPILAFIRRSRTQVRFAPLSRQPGAPRKAVSALHQQRLSQTTSSWGRS